MHGVPEGGGWSRQREQRLQRLRGGRRRKKNAFGMQTTKAPRSGTWGTEESGKMRLELGLG